MLKFLLLAPIMLLGATAAQAQQLPWSDAEAELVVMTTDSAREASTSIPQYAVSVSVPDYSTSICYDVTKGAANDVVWKCYEVTPYGGMSHDHTYSMKEMGKFMANSDWAASRIHSFNRKSTQWAWEDVYNSTPDNNTLADIMNDVKAAPEFDVRLEYNELASAFAGGVPVYTVVATSLNDYPIDANKVKLVLNRGNCRATSTTYQRKVLRYGDAVTRINACSRLHEISVEVEGYEPARFTMK